MRPVRLGDRGSAVEDIQMRLRALGYDLGPTGIDGVFLGRTAEAVRAFQATRALEEDGLVGDLTWAALVDATFNLGDRALYLRMPYFHGHDVWTLQGALNALGFVCGPVDGIFGAFTERAVREFQANIGLPSDGIVGDETAGSLLQLRHAWEGREQKPHSAAKGTTVRPAAALESVSLVLVAADDDAYDVCRRVANLAHADAADAHVEVVRDLDAEARPGAVTLIVASDAGVLEPRPDIRQLSVSALARRGILGSVPEEGAVLSVIVTGPANDARARQRAAIGLLDALCASYGG